MDTTIERVIFLQKIELFKDIPSEQLAHLASITKFVSIDEEKVMFKKGDDSRHLYLLIQGKVELERTPKHKGEFTGPEAIGVWGFFDQEPRLMTATCVEESHFLRIATTDFFDLLEVRPDLNKGLFKYFTRRVRTLIEMSDIVI
jgi:CRP-like cAMP-binding protein